MIHLFWIEINSMLSFNKRVLHIICTTECLSFDLKDFWCHAIWLHWLNEITQSSNYTVLCWAYLCMYFRLHASAMSMHSYLRDFFYLEIVSNRKSAVVTHASHSIYFCIPSIHTYVLVHIRIPKNISMRLSMKQSHKLFCWL